MIWKPALLVVFMAIQPLIIKEMPICYSCLAQPSIPNSHAIPRSFFKNISRKDSGKLIVITDGPNLARKSGDNSASHILCGKCEKQFDVKFDRIAIDAVRAIISAHNSGKKEITLDNWTAVCRSLASIFWRCSKSKSEFYGAFRPNPAFEGLLEADWRGNGELGLSYKMDPLVDPTPIAAGGFSARSLELFLMAPRLFSVSHGYRGRTKNGIGTILLMGGVVVTAFAPRQSKTRERRSGYVQANGKLPLKGANMWEIPFLKEFLVQAVRKEQIAESTTAITS